MPTSQNSSKGVTSKQKSRGRLIRIAVLAGLSVVAVSLDIFRPGISGKIWDIISEITTVIVSQP